LRTAAIVYEKHKVDADSKPSVSKGRLLLLQTLQAQVERFAEEKHGTSRFSPTLERIRAKFRKLFFWNKWSRQPGIGRLRGLLKSKVKWTQTQAPIAARMDFPAASAKLVEPSAERQLQSLND
jgi:hypothetical protein